MPSQFLHTDALDVYLDRKDRTWIIDFNPFGHPTNPLLFEWDELTTTPGPQGGSLVDSFRLVESEEEVLPNERGQSSGPIDVHLANEFPQFMKICKEQQMEEEGSDSSVTCKDSSVS